MSSLHWPRLIPRPRSYWEPGTEARALVWNYGTSLCVLDPQCFQRWMPSTIPALLQWAWLDSSVPGTSPSIFSHSRLPLRLQLGVQWCANLVRWPLSLPTCWQRSWMKQVGGRSAASSIQDFALILSGFQKIVYLYFKDWFCSKGKPTQSMTLTCWNVSKFLLQCAVLVPLLFSICVHVECKMGKAQGWG